MIKIKNLNKSFADNHVLKNISAEFEQGKVNLIIGQSGSGKTVMLKSTVGLYDIDNGKILYDDRNYCEMNLIKKKEIRKEIGMVFQGGALFDFATVEENISFPLNIFTSMSEEEKKDRVNFCLEKVNIKNANKNYPSEISGGMQKRVAIARAIVLNPKYLFFDEPNSGLDPKTAQRIDELIKNITYEFNTVTIINTHDMNSVLEIGDNIIYIHEGAKHWQGNKEEILKTDNEKLNDFVFTSKILRDFR